GTDFSTTRTSRTISFSTICEGVVLFASDDGVGEGVIATSVSCPCGTNLLNKASIVRPKWKKLSLSLLIQDRGVNCEFILIPRTRGEYSGVCVSLASLCSNICAVVATRC